MVKIGAFMKKVITIIMGILMVFVFVNMANANPRVVLDDVILSFDSEPIENNGRILVSLKTIFEALGATVEWDDYSQTVTAKKDNTEIKLVIGGKACKNNQAVSLDVPAKVVNGGTLIPIRFVLEVLWATVSWQNNTVIISSLSNYVDLKESSTSDYLILKSIDFAGEWGSEIIDELSELMISDGFSEYRYSLLLDKIYYFEIPEGLSAETRGNLYDIKSNFMSAFNCLVQYKESLLDNYIEEAMKCCDEVVYYYGEAVSIYEEMLERCREEYFGDSFIEPKLKYNII